MVPLNKKLQKDRPTRFGQFIQEVTAAMKALLEKLTSPTVMDLPRRGS